jgi:hypothetical protein
LAHSGPCHPGQPNPVKSSIHCSATRRFTWYTVDHVVQDNPVKSTIYCSATRRFTTWYTVDHVVQDSPVKSSIHSIVVLSGGSPLDTLSTILSGVSSEVKHCSAIWRFTTWHALDHVVQDNSMKSSIHSSATRRFTTWYTLLCCLDHLVRSSIHCDATGDSPLCMW